MKIFILIAQESSQYLGLKYIYTPYIKRIGFFAFCVYKNVSQKNRSLYINENNNDSRQRKITCTFCIYKKQNKLKRLYIYKKSDTLKKQDNFRYVFIYKKPHTLRNAIFPWNSWNWHFYIPSPFNIKYNTTPGRVSSPNRAAAVAMASSGK